MRLLLIPCLVVCLISRFSASAMGGELPKATDLKDNLKVRLVSA